jgi:transcriptional regulator with XRE-family HTH domain
MVSPRELEAGMLKLPEPLLEPFDFETAESFVEPGEDSTTGRMLDRETEPLEPPTDPLDLGRPRRFERPREHKLTGIAIEIFKRKRAQIGLTLEQLSRISGLPFDELKELERSRPGYGLLYDHAVALARVLGIHPSELPGLRPRSQPERLAFEDVRAWLLAMPRLRYEGQEGERIEGDVDRAGLGEAVCVQVMDQSLAGVYPRGSLLGFSSVADRRVSDGVVVLLRGKRHRQLALRRAGTGLFEGVMPWQTPYVEATGEWFVVCQLTLVLPPT